MKILIRHYHPYWEWEEVAANMWGKVSNRSEMLEKAIAFTGDHIVYGAAMMRVCDEWEKSCRHNLSNSSQNRRAWIGHAACALIFKCPEDIVRAAWAHLSEEQQVLANAMADKAIEYWESTYGEWEDAKEKA